MIGSVEKVSWIIGVPWQIHQTEQPIKKVLIHLAIQNSYVVSNQQATRKNITTNLLEKGMGWMPGESLDQMASVDNQLHIPCSCSLLIFKYVYFPFCIENLIKRSLLLN